MSSAATKRARTLRRSETVAEQALWRALRDRQSGVKFRRQHPLAGFTLDLYCEELKLCVEVDGGQHDAQADEDARRTAALNRLGVEVVRYWNNEVLENFEGVWTQLAEEIERRRREMG